MTRLFTTFTLLILALGAVLAAVGVAPATRAQTPERPVVTGAVADADTAFQTQDYSRVIALLSPLTHEATVPDPKRRAQILERLGASHWFLDALPQARLTFELLLRINAKHQLDAFFYPGELIAFFNAERRRLDDAGALGPKDPIKGPPETVMRETRYLLRDEIRNDVPDIAYLMPFGVGQFLNGDDGLGAVLAVLQGVGIILNITGWLVIETVQDPYISADEVARAELAQGLWIAGTALASASYLYSVVDGFVARPSGPTVRWRLESEVPGDLPPELRETLDPGAEPGPPLSSTTTFRLGGGPGLGLGLNGTF